MSIIDDIQEVQNMQRSKLEVLRNTLSPIILFGTGVYAYVLKRFLEASGITITHVMVDAEYKTIETFLGVKVSTTDELVGLLAGAHIVVGITNHPVATAAIRKRGAGEIYVIDIPDYLNMPHPFMDMAFVRAHLKEFDNARNVFSDDLSRHTYTALINAKINEDVEFLTPYVRPDSIYFPQSEFQLCDDEVFLDVGGYTGDTVKEFHRATSGHYKQIISLEPSEANFTELVTAISCLDKYRITAHRVGAWDERATLRFATKEMHIDNQISNDGDQSIEVDTIDSIIGDTGPKITLMKLDINGAEFRALKGAVKTIKRCRPRIISRLHTKEDFYRTPLLLRSISPSVRIFLRQRSYFSVMAILYAEFDSLL